MNNGDRLILVQCLLPTIDNPQSSLVVKKNLVAQSVGDYYFTAQEAWAAGSNNRLARKATDKFKKESLGKMLVDGCRRRIVVHESAELEPIINEMRNLCDQHYTKVMTHLNTQIERIQKIKDTGISGIEVTIMDCSKRYSQ